MLKGKGEIRDFNWKTGQGILHKEEFKECTKTCMKPEHCVIFNWRHILSPEDVADGKVFSYSAHPKGDDAAAPAKSLWPVYIGR